MNNYEKKGIEFFEKIHDFGKVLYEFSIVESVFNGNRS